MQGAHPLAGGQARRVRGCPGSLASDFSAARAANGVAGRGKGEARARRSLPRRPAAPAGQGEETRVCYFFMELVQEASNLWPSNALKP